MPEIDDEKNAQGFALWPKWVKDKEGKSVVVHNKKEETEVCGTKEEKSKSKANEVKAGWTE